MKRNWLAVGIILLFVGTCAIPAIAQNTERPLPTSEGNWLYVGGSGPGNYSKIQDAIDSASDGDTVFVFDDSSPYYENVIINKSITLAGENKETTIIDGSKNQEDIVEIDSSYVTIKDFTIRNSLELTWGISSSWNNRDNISIINNIITYNSGAISIRYCQGLNIFGNTISRNYRQAIELYATSNAIISQNTIIEHYTPDIGTGVFLFRSNNNTILNNSILSNDGGIDCGNSHSNKILANTILFCQSWAICLSNSTNNEITSNRIFGKIGGICIVYYSNYNNITLNNISSSFMESIFLDESIFNEIHQNNFLKKTKNAGFSRSIRNNWNDNFWYKPRVLPKPIIGDFFLTRLGRYFPCINLDWHPAQEPFDIGG
jgi:parallel beta-helix repeat protein